MIIGDGPAVRLGLLVITPVETAVFVALFASPQAVYSTVMSTEMGGDGHLAGQIVVWCSILGMFSLFLIVFLLRETGDGSLSPFCEMETENRPLSPPAQTCLESGSSIR